MLIKDYRISLWNYFWYHTLGSLEDLMDEIRQAGYGIEFWDRWKEHLVKTNYTGAAVFEVRPRRPGVVADRSVEFFEAV